MSRTMNRRGPSFLTGLGAGAPMLVGLYGVMWALEIVDLALGHSLDSFGIRPRTVEGLLCIPLAPFLHFGFIHLFCNTFFGMPVAAAAMRRSLVDFFVVSVSAALVSGAGTWLFGADHSIHAGFSGVIFGYLGFLFGMGRWGPRDGGPVLNQSALVQMFVLSLLPGVSFTGHLFGFIGGLLVSLVRAGAMRRRGWQ